MTSIEVPDPVFVMHDDYNWETYERTFSVQIYDVITVWSKTYDGHEHDEYLVSQAREDFAKWLARRLLTIGADPARGA